MQGKSFVRFFTIALVLVVSYIFLLMIPTNMVESNAENYAAAQVDTVNNDEDPEVQYDKAHQYFLDSISDEPVLNLGFKSYTYQELKRNQLALGLDLKGGMSVVLQVDLTELIKKLSKDNADKDFNKAIAEAKAAQNSSQTDFVTLFGQKYAELSSKPLARFFIASDKLQGIDVNSSNEEVLTAIRAEASATVERTFNLLKQRIDKFGVAQPVVSLDKSTDRITVELPGVRSPERARQFLQGTANLEFWEMYTALEVFGQQGNGPIVQLNNELRGSKYDDTKNQNDTTAAPVVLDSITQAKIDAIRADSTLSDSLKDLRADSITKQYEDNFAKNDTTNRGPLFSKISIMIDQSTTENDPFRAMVSTRDTARVMELLNSDIAKRTLPRDLKFAWENEVQKGEAGERFVQLFALRTRGKKEAPLQGDRITNSMPTSNPSGFGYAVSLSMDSKGAREWKKMTEDNVERCVAVVLDGRIYSWPRVNEVIANGNTSISGNFSATDATDLANILSIGKLPAKPEIIEEAIIGPTLGQKTVNAGLLALVIGFVLVLAFMLLYYAGAGMLSVIALFLNIFFIFGCLASFGTVLTLPGIAGIVLTIGMAVDANVIIFERIREELRSGFGWKESIRNGFKYSYSAIIDANVTSFVTALILFQYGLGPIKGFATVLMIGVACSVFAAVLFGRLLFDRFLVRNKEIKVWSGATKNVLSNVNFDFIGKRKIAYAVSSILLIAGLASMFTQGFELGVDFQGGRSYTVEFPADVKVADLKVKLTEAFDGYDKNVVKTFNQGNQVKITTSYRQDENDQAVDVAVLEQLFKGAKAYAGTDADFEVFKKGKAENSNEAGLYLLANSKVGPTIADDIRQSAFWASILSLLFIFVYILLRFRRWQFSVGAIAALFHDVIIVLGLFSLFKGIMPFSMEIDQAFIAALLTIIGYSINDTVIVFDRIRETATNNPDSKISWIVNKAIGSTLSRTSITSLTTFFVVFILFLFGGDGIRGFAFALLIGIIVGTYSSMFIASPVVVDTTSDAGSLKYTEHEDDDPVLMGEGEVVTDENDEKA
jgi:SecD/SecF fusion protein